MSSAFNVVSFPLVSVISLLPIYPVGLDDVAIGFDRVPFNVDRRSSPSRIVSIISLRFLLSPPFSTSLCVFKRSHDTVVVDLYSAFTISLTVTIEVGGIDGVGGIEGVDIVGVAILAIVVGKVAIPDIAIGDVTRPEIAIGVVTVPEIL